MDVRYDDMDVRYDDMDVRHDDMKVDTVTMTWMSVTHSQHPHHSHH